jgi:hypothetical protein
MLKIQYNQDLQCIDVDKNATICSFDINNKYTNIPQQNVINIIKFSALIDEKEQLLPIINTILKQNYFQHNQDFYKQTQGHAMGAPTLSIFTEICMQCLEHKRIYEILIHHKIIAYLDMLVIY